MYREYDVPVAWEKFTETLHKVKTTHFNFSSCMGVFIGNIGDWLVKDFRYCNMITNATSVYCNGTCMMGITASGSWENNCMAGEHTLITSLVLDNIIKMYKLQCCGSKGIVNELTNPWTTSAHSTIPPFICYVTILKEHFKLCIFQVFSPLESTHLFNCFRRSQAQKVWEPLL